MLLSPRKLRCKDLLALQSGSRQQTLPRPALNDLLDPQSLWFILGIYMDLLSNLLDFLLNPLGRLNPSSSCDKAFRRIGKGSPQIQLRGGLISLSRWPICFSSSACRSLSAFVFGGSVVLYNLKGPYLTLGFLNDCVIFCWRPL